MRLTKRVRKAVGYLLGFPRTARPAVRAFRVELEGAAAETRVDEVAPEGACAGLATRDIPLLHHLPQSEPCVAAYGVSAGSARRVVVHFPGFVSHATVAVDSGVFADALPLGGIRAPVVLPVAAH